jgi:hypothetical protein
MSFRTVFALGLVYAFCNSCGKKSSGGSSTGGGDVPPPNNKAPSGGFDPSKTLLDLRGALGFAKLETTAQSQRLLLSSQDSSYLDNPGAQKSSVAKVTQDRSIKNIFINEDGSQYANTYGRPPELYKSPTGALYVFFPDGVYDQSKATQGGKPNSCQIFKASAGLTELTAVDASPNKLECLIWLEDKRIDSMSWGMQGAPPTLQFDAQGRIIVRVWSNTGGGGEIVRIDPSNSSTKLMVNSNIMVGKFFSTPQGGLYYTANMNGTNYFRYVDKNGSLVQIAESSSGPSLFFPVPNDPNDKVLYVGPHPGTQGNQSGWVQPEFLFFNPSLGNPDDENRILTQVSKAVTSPLYLGSSPQTGPNGEAKPTASQFRATCEAGGVDYTYANNLSSGTIIPEKNGDYLFINATGASWSNYNYYAPGKVVCYNSSPYQQGPSCDSVEQVDWVKCVDTNVPTNNETEIQAAYNSSNQRVALKTPILRLTAGGALRPVAFPADIQVKKVWKIGSDFFYLQSKNSVFSLKKWVDGNPTNGDAGDRMIKHKFEIYSLAKSGPNELMFSGLDFNTNECGMGYINLETLQAEMKDDVKTKVADIVTLED